MREDGLLREAQRLYRLSDYQESYQDYLKLTLLYGDGMDAGSYAEKAAICLQRLGRNDEAIIWLERAVIERPNFPPFEEALERAKRGEMIDADKG